MKRTITILSAALLAATAIHAQNDMGLKENQMVIGHTITNDYSSEGAYIGEAGTYPIGASLSATALAPYAGCQIIGMRIASTLNQASTRIFIYDCSDLNTAVHEQKNRLYPGWTNVIFNGNGIEIKGDEELFFGYDYVETPEIATGEIGPIGVTGTQTPGGFNLLRNGELIELTGAGVVCVQLIIDITNLPQTNLAFTFTDTGFKYKQLGEQISFFASVANVGRDDVENFTAEIALDGNIIDTQQVDMALKAGASETWQTNIKLPETTGIGTHHLTIAITGINGVETDRRPTATCSTSFAYFSESITRKRAYIEAFSSQQYAYSPYLDNVLADYKTKADMSRAAIVKIFEPATPLAVTGAESLWNLYAYDVPVFSVNRSLFVGEKNVAYCLNDYLVLPPDVLTAVFTDIINQDLATPSFAEVNVATSYNEATKALNVNISGKILPELEAIYGETALTVMLVEDNVKEQQGVINSSGQTTINNNYIHNDVLRAYIGNPQGVAITPVGNSYSVDLEMTLNTSKFNPDQCRVVAVLSKKGNPTLENVADFDIVNTDQAPVKGPAGIEGIEADGSNVTYRWFTIDGIEVPASNLSDGLYIRLGSDGTSAKLHLRN